jgi:hypothetical protein
VSAHHSPQRFRYYVLDADGEPVGTNDAMVFARWFEAARTDGTRIVRQDLDAAGVGVSTVFLGLDQSWHGGPPVLWETLVFGTPLDGEMRRYTSKADAIRGHAEMLALVRDALDKE